MAKPRILVVEDHALTRKFYVAAIRDRLPDSEIFEASSVATAQAKLVEGPALVLTDILLGDGNGNEVLSAVRASSQPEACVVAVTGLTGHELDDLRRGFDAVLTKPVNLAELREVLARVFVI